MRHLALELQDDVTQTLFAASLIADVLPEGLNDDPDERRRRLAELAQLTRGALAGMRVLRRELWPATLTELPLGSLLQQLAEAVTGCKRRQIELTIGHSLSQFSATPQW